MAKTRLTTNRPSSRPSSIEDALRKLEDALAEPTPSVGEIASADLERLKSQVVSFSNETLGRTLDSIGENSSLVKAVGREAVQEMLRQGTDLARRAGDAAKENPWPLIGGAAFAALVVGATLGARKNESGRPI